MFHKWTQILVFCRCTSKTLKCRLSRLSRPHVLCRFHGIVSKSYFIQWSRNLKNFQWVCRVSNLSPPFDYRFFVLRNSANLSYVLPPKGGKKKKKKRTRENGGWGPIHLWCLVGFLVLWWLGWGIMFLDCSCLFIYLGTVLQNIFLKDNLLQACCFCFPRCLVLRIKTTLGAIIKIMQLSR